MWQKPTDSARPVPNVEAVSQGMRMVSGLSTRKFSTYYESECTLVVKGVPARYTQAGLLQLWSPREYNYNFMFSPYSKKQHRSATYCFTNFTSMDAALGFQLR